MKHEEHYQGCFDYLFLEVPELNCGPTLKSVLLQRVGATVTDPERFEREAMTWMAGLHESGLIRPATREEMQHKQYWIIDPEIQKL